MRKVHGFRDQGLEASGVLGLRILKLQHVELPGLCPQVTSRENPHEP